MLLVALGASLLSFGVMAWGMPAGNQALRELALQADAAQFRRPVPAPLLKGPNEMTLSELWREGQNVASEGDHSRARWYWWTFHLRFTLPTAVIAVAAFMLFVPIQGRAVRGTIAFAVCFSYWALIYVGEFGVRRDYLAPSIGAWLPNMALVACAMVAAAWPASRFGASRLRSR
jgi:lipopolysaccharide export LptBFGC system permease protein LptF